MRRSTIILALLFVSAFCLSPRNLAGGQVERSTIRGANGKFLGTTTKIGRHTYVRNARGRTVATIEHKRSASSSSSQKTGKRK